jgi:hypothetical protein
MWREGLKKKERRERISIHKREVIGREKERCVLKEPKRDMWKEGLIERERVM